MREIKFRAWDKTEKVMLHWDFIEDDMLPTVLSHGDFIPMQYTGLKDKNGKEIYEEDIVMADGRKGLAQWNTSEPFYWVRFGENKFNYLQDVIEIEVIGNIYENPELLNPHTT